MSIKNKIILIGFMGTGKSSVATKLCKQLSFTHQDMDQEIINTAGYSISEIFANHGEEVFRDQETSTLKRLLQNSEASVIATGGGAVLRPENRELMLEHGFVVALHAAKDIIIKRVSQDQSRPLLAGDLEQRVETLMEARKGLYDFAHVSIDTSSLSLEQVVEQIVDSWHNSQSR